MTHASSMDHAKRAKQGFMLGAGLFLTAIVAEFVGHAMYGTLPGWEQTLLVDAEIAGILIALFAPLVFGIVLPLVE